MSDEKVIENMISLVEKLEKDYIAKVNNNDATKKTDVIDNIIAALDQEMKNEN